MKTVRGNNKYVPIRKFKGNKPGETFNVESSNTIYLNLNLVRETSKLMPYIGIDEKVHFGAKVYDEDLIEEIRMLIVKNMNKKLNNDKGDC